MWIAEEKLAPNPEYEAIFNEKKKHNMCAGWKALPCTHGKMGHAVSISPLLKFLHPTAVCTLCSSKQDSFSFVFWAANIYTLTSTERAVM